MTVFLFIVDPNSMRPKNSLVVVYQPGAFTQPKGACRLHDQTGLTNIFKARMMVSRSKLFKNGRLIRREDIARLGQNFLSCFAQNGLTVRMESAQSDSIIPLQMLLCFLYQNSSIFINSYNTSLFFLSHLKLTYRTHSTRVHRVF